MIQQPSWLFVQIKHFSIFFCKNFHYFPRFFAQIPSISRRENETKNRCKVWLHFWRSAIITGIAHLFRLVLTGVDLAIFFFNRILPGKTNRALTFYEPQRFLVIKIEITTLSFFCKLFLSSQRLKNFLHSQVIKKSNLKKKLAFYSNVPIVDDTPSASQLEKSRL